MADGKVDKQQKDSKKKSKKGKSKKKARIPKPYFIKKTDITSGMQKDLLDLAALAMSKFNGEKDIARFLIKEFEMKYDGTWQCIVGKNYSLAMGYTCHNFLNFFMGKFSFTVFKTK